jgi:hypothetical protein
MTSHDTLTLTIRESSLATGLSVKALRRRIERGTLRAELIDGVRRVPVSELLRAGLLVRDRPAGGAPPPAPTPPVVNSLVRRIAALEGRVAMLERALADARSGDGATSLERYRADAASADGASPQM